MPTRKTSSLVLPEGGDLQARLGKRVADWFTRNPPTCSLHSATHLSFVRCELIRSRPPAENPNGKLRVAFAYWLSDCPDCLRQSEREAWCEAQLAAWQLEDDANFNFQWAKDFASTADDLLQLGIIYEYARESTVLRRLLAVCVAHDDDDGKRARRPRMRLLNPPWLQARDAGQRGEEFGQHSWKCASAGVDEHKAEDRLGGLWAPLRTLAFELVQNLPFARLPDTQRKCALRNWRLKVPTAFWHWESIAPDFEARAVGHETLESSFWARRDQAHPASPARAGSRDRKKHAERVERLRKNAGVERIILRINWNEEDPQLKRAFEEFLARHRPFDPPSSASSSRLAKLGLLDALAAMRLTRQHQTREAAFRRHKETTLLPRKVSVEGDFFHPGNWSAKLSHARDFFDRNFTFGDETPANRPLRKAPVKVVR